MKILCNILGHKYRKIYNIFNEPIKEKCIRCIDIIDYNYISALMELDEDE